VFEQDAKVGGFFVDCDYSFSASYYDPVDGKVYYVPDTDGDVFQWDALEQPPVTQRWKSKVIVTKDMINLGAARVIADYAVTSVLWEAETGTWNATGDGWNAAGDLIFRMWADKELLFTTTVTDSDTFRLPTGYRTDTFEFELEGDIRVRALHLAETPLALREV
jgi:hypothetical protein